MNFLVPFLQSEKRRTRILIASLSIALVSTLVVISTLIYQLVIANRIPPLPSHLDLSSRPMESFAQSLNQSFPSDLGNYQDSKCPALTQAGLAKENALPGISMNSADWRALQFDEPAGSVIWMDQNSANCGDLLTIHGSTYDNYSSKDLKAPRTIAALRIGWYGGSGAREIWRSGPIVFPHLNIPKPTGATRLIETNWPVLAKVQITSSWTPGFYLLVTYSPSGRIESEDPLVIHNKLGTSKVAIMHSFLTWQMYNSFGGNSGYVGPGGTLDDERTNRSREVSFNRPYAGSGAFAIKRDALSMMQFLEKNNVLVDNYSDLDLNTYPSIFTHYNEMIISGHAEYMPRRLFDSYIAARNNGINLALFGANDAYWQTRLSANGKVPDRHVYMYRVATQDPVTQWDQVTLEYSDKRVNTPSNLITGGLTSGVHVYGTLYTKSDPSWLGIPANSKIESISPDSEVESSVPTPASPPNIHVLFQGTLNYTVAPDIKNYVAPQVQSLWFTLPSGSAVFNGGFTTWACDLADSCVYPSITPQTQNLLQQVTLKIINLWSEKGIGSKLASSK